MREQAPRRKRVPRRMQFSHEKVLLWLVVLFLTAASSSCHFNRKAAPTKESQADRLNGLFDRSRIVLTSRKKDGEVRIPFTLRDGLIHLKMVWAGRPVEAILDTGSAFIAWPPSLHLASTRTGIPQDSKMAAGVVKRGEWTVLSSIKAGDCEWQDIPTVADEKMKLASLKSHRTALKTVAPPAPLLGAPAFHGAVLTIDYQKQEIIIRASSYDITHLPRHHHDLLLTPEWVNGYLPVLKGTLANHPARFALDSASEKILVNSQFVSRLPAPSFGHAMTAELNGVQVNILGLKHILRRSGRCPSPGR